MCPEEPLLRYDYWLGHQGTKNQKQKMCYNSWTNGWITLKLLSDVYLVGIHDLVYGFLIWPCKVREVKVPSITVGWHVFWCIELECSNLLHVPLGKSNSQTNYWTNGWITLNFLLEVYLVGIHYIIYRFLIWPTLQGYTHRDQSSKHYC
jgi:hypothetical protein